MGNGRRSAVSTGDMLQVLEHDVLVPSLIANAAASLSSSKAG
jgi:hypothetical protein